MARSILAVAVASWAASLALAGCAGPLARSEAQFADGLYPDAKQSLISLQLESRGWSDAKRAEYALYRGLTHAALGDREQARVWLREAKAIEATHPTSLSREDTQRLKVGMDSAGE
ncbi:MAG: hypothetical protein M3O46_15660 [Myxococcota bacterium]|nr:hypothetical protein [Myxococcota bacterium]